MEFSINKNSTLPVLKLSLIQDGRHSFSEFYNKIQNADIFFTMTDVITGVKKIAKKPTSIELVKPEVDCVGDEYYITYQFTERDTINSGRFIGKFTIEFLDGSGTLIVPIREDLYINILDSGIKK
jgi:hypothetical protein